MASVKGKKNRIYTDIDLSFGVNAFSGDINKKLDVNAVKQSIKTLLLTQSGEKPFHPEIGSGIRELLFEPLSPVTAFVLSQKVEDVIENFEPRARLVGVRALPDLDRNSYEISIEFYVQNAPTELVDTTVLLERLREYYSRLNNLSYNEIKKDKKDYRAERITSYLNMVNRIVMQKFEYFTSSTNRFILLAVFLFSSS